MTEIALNSAVAIVIASAFLITATAALRNPEKSLQRVPVRVKTSRDLRR